MYFRLEEKQNREGKIMFTTGDKLLNMMKEEEIGIMELSRISGVPERTILDILTGIKEPELGVMCKIAEGLGICVHELCADEECYAVSVPKDTLAKLIVVSEINDVEFEVLLHSILEKEIEDNSFCE
jgi:predicted transcriptional regulator